ncbi:diguanylate cyclase/phosphodiesterase with PAS/PAC sensor [gamma proteobacterium IMCC2047]|nr:diguanylate cyclase/phosphodiesterase with PAS/PAC sensor [gamma proteobacterium IMCC2047]
MTTTPDIILSKLAQLQSSGVKISIDDFGTGFSALAYFRDLTVNELKIDKSFVLKVLASQKDLIIVKAVIELAHYFSLSVVAEGVETQAAVNKLNELNCDQLQDYYFDRPLVASDFEKRYLNN